MCELRRTGVRVRFVELNYRMTSVVKLPARNDVTKIRIKDQGYGAEFLCVLQLMIIMLEKFTHNVDVKTYKYILNDCMSIYLM